MNAISAQSCFAAALLEPGLDLPAGLRVSTGINPARRFTVHRNNVVVALVDALAAAFPVTQALVGVDFFRAMARERVRIDPPRSPIIYSYGAGFADFIATCHAAAPVAYLADVARLEYMRAQAYHAADADPIDVSLFQDLLATPERIAGTRLVLHPACAWLSSRHAVHSIWLAHQDLDDIGDANLGAIDLDTPECVLVTRPQWQVSVDSLPSGTTAVLDRLRTGVPLGALHLDRRRQASTVSLETLLLLLIRHRLVVALDTPPE
jgi:hypothetical protein